MYVSMPWYDHPGVRWAHDAWWERARASLAVPLPPLLDRTTAVATQWASDALLLSQACGLDLMFEPQLHVVAAPSFDLRDCPRGSYFSVVVARHGVSLPAAPAAAVNSRRSHSGYTALLETTTPGMLTETGSHRASLDRVRDGRCDMACIDAVTWRILEREYPGMDVLARSEPAPAPPFVSSPRLAETAAHVAAALDRAIRSRAMAGVREALHVEGIVPATRADYTGVFGRYAAVRSSG